MPGTAGQFETLLMLIIHENELNRFFFFDNYLLYLYVVFDALMKVLIVITCSNF